MELPNRTWILSLGRSSMGSETLVMVRAFGGKPLRRILQKATKKAFFVTNPESSAGGSMGFPVADVFIFDPPLFDNFLRVFRANGTVPDGLWDRAVPFSGTPESHPGLD